MSCCAVLSKSSPLVAAGSLLLSKMRSTAASSPDSISRLAVRSATGTRASWNLIQGRSERMFDVARSISSVPAKLPAATERCCAIRAPPSSILKGSKRDPYISIPNSSCLRLRSVKSGSSAANSGASSISFTSAAETSRAIHRNRINPDAIRDWNSRPSAEANAIAVVAGKASSKSSKDNRFKHHYGAFGCPPSAK